MKRITNSEHTDRRGAAKDAKAALVEAFRAAKEAAEPTREAKQAERRMIAEAREQRRAEREQAKLEEQNRVAAEAAARDAAVAAAARAEIDARELADKPASSSVAWVIIRPMSDHLGGRRPQPRENMDLDPFNSRPLRRSGRTRAMAELAAHFALLFSTQRKSGFRI